MKRAATFFVSILVWSVVHSQNYRMMNANSEMFFTSNANMYPYYNLGEVYGLKCDSIEGTLSDSSYFPYRTIIETTPNTSCNGDPSYPIWAGSKITIDNAQKHKWQTLAGDSVIIKTFTNPGDTQQIYLYPNGDRIVAIHISNTLSTFSAFTDSVKNYSMQILDATNTIVNGFWNGKQIIVSKSHGVVQMPGIINFPNDTFMFARVDAKRLKYGDCYPWQPGDVLHETYSIFNQMTFNGCSDTYNETILSRTMINTDSVVFSVRRVTHHTCNGPLIDTMMIDTITESFGHLSSYVESTMPQQTIDSIRSYDLYLLPSDCGKERMIDHTVNQFMINGPGCVQADDFEPMFHDNIYIDGVAGYYFYDAPSAQNNVTSADYHNFYWYINAVSCGTPLYLGTQELSKTEFNVWPNPVSDQLHFDFDPSKEYSLTIFDVAGKQIREVKLNTNFSIDVSDLANEIYFGKITTPDGQIFVTRFVKE